MSGYLEQLRARIGPRKAIVIYATTLIRDVNGRLLFQRRTDFDWWGLPGGVLELGETLAQCAIREAREETGLRVEPRKLVGVYSGPQYDVRYPNGDEVQQFTAALECQLVDEHGDGRADGTESVEQAFFAPEALPPTARWYADMARDLFAAREAAFFEPPRPDAPDGRGETIMSLRKRMGKEWIIAPGASAFLRDEAGRVLLVRRADNGRWMIPSGFMDMGESVAETVVREMREETGLLVEPTRLIGVYTGPDYQTTYVNGDPVQFSSAFFECRLVGGSLRPDPREITAAAFFPPEALPEPINPRVANRLADALQNLPYTLFT